MPDFRQLETNQQKSDTFPPFGQDPLPPRITKAYRVTTEPAADHRSYEVLPSERESTSDREQRAPVSDLSRH
jgi:hypothetical protein